MKQIARLLAAAITVVAIATPAMAESYAITSGVWGYYQKYLRMIGSTKPGAFAITRDGASAFVSWCQDIRCMAGTTYRHDAVTYCEQQTGQACVVFADRTDIVVDYTIVGGQATTASGAAPDLSPAPVTRLTLSAKAKEAVDRYLKSSTMGGKAWALAVAKDGSDAAGANCPTSGGGGYFGGGANCDLNTATAQELANREAMKRCGGPDDCVLLYIGRQKAANVELQ